MYIGRVLESKIKKYLKRKEIIAIVGARQCGKTTLMKKVFHEQKNARFISFDDQKILRAFNEDIDYFVKNFVEGSDFLFIDEFQCAKDGGKKLKYIYDSQNVKLFISGSSAAELSIQSLKYLVGRIFVLTLYPLSFEEFLKHKNAKLHDLVREQKKLSGLVVESINRLYEEFLVFGGYPAVVLAKGREEKIEILRNIYNTYLLREVREILQISQDAQLAKLVKALALQAGGEANYNELSTLTSFGYKDLTRFISVLIKTFVCLESRPFFSNKRKELVKSPKFFFLDSGFRNIVMDNFQEPQARLDRGALNENFVASEMSKMGFGLSYWRTKAGAEVDFVLELEGRIIPIEVKTLLKVPKYGKSFINFLDYYKPREGYVFSLNYFHDSELQGRKVYFRPVFLVPYLLAGRLAS